MAKFTYYAKKIDGEDVEGIREAKDRFELSHLLREQGYTLVSYKEVSEQKESNILSSIGRVSLQEKMLFSRNLSVMISAGVSITKGLDVLCRQTKNPKFKDILSEIKSFVQKGESLSESIKRYPKVFSPLFAAMVKVGEETGKLSEALILVANQLDKEHKLVKKIRGAMIYPAIVIFAMIAIGVFMLIYVVPTLTATFAELKIELPTSTKVIIGTSNFMQAHIVLFLIILAVVALLLIRFLKTKIGKNIFDAFLIHAPLISPIVKKINSSRTTRTMSSLISAGVNIVETLSITQDVIQNHYYKDVLETAKKNTQKGLPVSGAFKEAEKLYPILVGEMMSVGEETGELSAMLERLAVFYEEEVEEATKDLSTVVEPILMILIGLGVGFFALAMIKPMYSMMEGL